MEFRLLITCKKCSLKIFSHAVITKPISINIDLFITLSLLMVFLSLLVGLYGCLVTMHCCPQECDFAKIKVEEPRQIFTVGFETQVVLICDNCFIVLWQLVSFSWQKSLAQFPRPPNYTIVGEEQKRQKSWQFCGLP